MISGAVEPFSGFIVPCCSGGGVVVFLPLWFLPERGQGGAGGAGDIVRVFVLCSEGLGSDSPERRAPEGGGIEAFLTQELLEVGPAPCPSGLFFAESVPPFKDLELLLCCCPVELFTSVRRSG